MSSSSLVTPFSVLFKSFLSIIAPYFIISPMPLSHSSWGKLSIRLAYGHQTTGNVCKVLPLPRLTVVCPIDESIMVSKVVGICAYLMPLRYVPRNRYVAYYAPPRLLSNG